MYWRPGVVEIGVTTRDPISFVFPQLSHIAGLKDAWVMSGRSIFINAHKTMEAYGRNLNQLSIGDRLGVTRTSAGGLHFYVNGIDQGSAATQLPSRVWAVVAFRSLFEQVSLVDDTE